MVVMRGDNMKLILGLTIGILTVLMPFMYTLHQCESSLPEGSYCVLIAVEAL